MHYGISTDFNHALLGPIIRGDVLAHVSAISTLKKQHYVQTKRPMSLDSKKEITNAKRHEGFQGQSWQNICLSRQGEAGWS